MARHSRPDEWVELEVAVRQVAECRSRVDRQRELMAQLRRAGRTTVHAERFLYLLETTLRQMMGREEALLAKVKESNDLQKKP